MKATLEFNLPDDKEDYEMTVNASKYYLALWGIKQELRKQLKYAEISEKEYEIYEKVSDKFHSILEDNGINGDF
jgi:hypothetical protein